MTLILSLVSACGTARPVATQAELQTRLEKTTGGNEALYQLMLHRLRGRLEQELAAGRVPQVNILTLSGGSEFGAFGAGFLHAWSQIPAGDPHAMPRFDLVTGISTGALIAPYALIGTTAALSKVDDLYRESKPAYAESRLWSFITGESGYYDITGLENIIRTDLQTTVVPGLQALPDQDRMAMVATTDMDLGLLHLWDVRQEASSVDRLYAIQRAAIAIPGAFDPVEIDGSLHADAGVLIQFITISNPEMIASVMAEWNAAHPTTPARIRQWIIINNKSHEPLMTVQTGWTDSLPRSMALMIKSGVIGPLTMITLQAALLRSQGFDVETRWMAIPSDLVVDPSLPPFDNRITVPLSDLGRRWGARQDHWSTQPPRFIGREISDPVVEPANAP